MTRSVELGIKACPYSNVVHFFIRFLGWLVAFVHNRRDPVENMIRGYSRATLVRGAPPDLRRAVLARWQNMGITMPASSILESTQTHLTRKRDAAKGTGRWTTSLHGRHKERGGVPLANDAGLPAALRRHNKLYENQQISMQTATLHVVSGGITMNGNTWREGSECEFVRGSTAYIGIVRRFFVIELPNATKVLFTQVKAYVSTSVDIFRTHTICFEDGSTTIVLHKELKHLVKICPHHTMPQMRRAITVAAVHKP